MSASCASKVIDDLSVDVRPNGACVVVKVAGELDALTAPRLSEQLVARDGAPSDLVIDLSELTFLDVKGIHVLLEACAPNGTRVVCPPGFIRRILDLVSFGDTVLVHESVEDALASSQPS